MFCIMCGADLEGGTSCKKCSYSFEPLIKWLKNFSQAPVIQFSKIPTSDVGSLKEILNFLWLNDSIDRLGDVRRFMQILDEKPVEAYQRTAAREFFDYAIQTYILGYDPASVYYSAVAAELALSSQVSEILPNKRLVKSALQRGLIKAKEARQTINLFQLRDAYVHYENFRRFMTGEIQEAATKVLSLQDVSSKEKEKFLRYSEWAIRLHESRYPSLSVSGTYLSKRRRTLVRFLRQTSKKYHRMLREIPPAEYLNDLKKQIPRHDLRRYHALDALRFSYDILAALQAFDSVVDSGVA